MQLDKTCNPFIAGLRIPFVERDVITSEAELVKTYKIETERHFRVYNSSNKRQLIFSLSIYARDMFMAILYNTNDDYTYFIITFDKMSNLLGDNMYGKRRFEDTVRELIKHGLIDYKDKEKGQYWYNPVFFAAGNRLKIYPDECQFRVN